MADQPADPVADTLKAAPVSDSVKAQVWDAYQQSTNEDVLAARLKSVPIPDAVKADLWDLKYQSKPIQSASVAPKENPSIGTMAKDVVIGAIKQPGRLVQAIPGVTALTDKLYGLPPGASEQSMQPTNTAQEVGGYVADAAEIAGAGAADAGMVYTRNALGQFTRAPYMGSVAGKALDIGSRVSQGAIAAVRTSLGVNGPITAEKIGGLVGRYGVKAVKAAMYGAGIGAGWEAWEALKK